MKQYVENLTRGIERTSKINNARQRRARTGARTQSHPLGSSRTNIGWPTNHTDDENDGSATDFEGDPRDGDEDAEDEDNEALHEPIRPHCELQFLSFAIWPGPIYPKCCNICRSYI